jgi:transcription elongation factor GreB
LAELEAERARLNADRSDEAERKRRLAVVAGRLAELVPRIAAAHVVEPRDPPQDEVRFGATVTLRTQDGQQRRYQIVGVDEADAAQGRVAFVAPIARAVLGLQVGDTATLRTARGTEALEIEAIEYEA